MRQGWSQVRACCKLFHWRGRHAGSYGIRKVGAEKVDQAALRSQWGEHRAVTLYAVALEINQYHFSAVRVVGDEIGNEVILGRNALNRLRLLLDGPAGMVEVLNAQS